MACTHGKTVLQLLRSRSATTTIVSGISHGPLPSPCQAVTPVFTRRRFHFSSIRLDKPAPAPTSASSGPQRSKERILGIWQRQGRREARNRLSTLALEHSGATAAEIDVGTETADARRRRGAKGENKSTNLMSRRIVFWSIILLMPVFGRDVMEVIVPALLGTIIYVGGKIKTGIRWARQLGSGGQR